MMNVLFTSAGRRVSLLRTFRRALDRQAEQGEILAADMEATAPAHYVADRAFVVPPVSSPEYVPCLLDLCQSERVRIVVPLIDPELPVLAHHALEFAQAGATLLTSSVDSVRVADDKLATAAFFAACGIPSPATFSAGEAEAALAAGRIRFPVVVKPRRGSAAEGLRCCRSEREVRFRLDRCNRDEVVVQECLGGNEVTIDVFGDGTGRVLAVIPRRRLKVRGGEVERGVTIDDAEFREFVLMLGSRLKPYGPINVQCFVTDGGPVFTEINARFGGGYPLSDAAGARFPDMVLDLARGRAIEPRLGIYQRGLVMMRFDNAFYVRETDLIGHGSQSVSVSPHTLSPPSAAAGPQHAGRPGGSQWCSE